MQRGPARGNGENTPSAGRRLPETAKGPGFRPTPPPQPVRPAGAGRAVGLSVLRAAV